MCWSYEMITIEAAKNTIFRRMEVLQSVFLCYCTNLPFSSLAAAHRCASVYECHQAETQSWIINKLSGGPSKCLVDFWIEREQVDNTTESRGDFGESRNYLIIRLLSQSDSNVVVSNAKLCILRAWCRALHFG